TTKDPAQLIGTLDRFPPTTETLYKNTEPLVLEPLNSSPARSTALRQPQFDTPIKLEGFQVGIVALQELEDKQRGRR
ncbi:hypothetical protein ACSNOI_17635, partial [Actinomadura kijaniata]|uniref:hypothetical protein n=1 Tax=Actinomadura kijaniata TaxID=46161 RepID=UPI003F1AED2E